MNRTIFAGAALALVGHTSCVAGGDPAEGWGRNMAALREELGSLQKQLEIPALAFAIVHDGRVAGSGAFGRAVGSDEPFTTSTPLAIQSITKAITAAVVMQLVAEGRLDLGDPVSDLLPGAPLAEGVEVRHLLTHTSEGLVGRDYVYGTARYAYLRGVVERATGMSLGEAIRSRVFEPAGMRWYPSPDLGAGSGLVSSVDELARFAEALDRGDLLDGASLRRLSTPSRSRGGRLLPVSLGWFAQNIQGEAVMWSYGQGGDPTESSALFLRVPERRLTLILLADGNAMSDRFRLLMGDAEKSSFAMAFVRLFIASPAGEPLPRPDWRSAELPRRLDELEGKGYSFEGELLGQVLIEGVKPTKGHAKEMFRIAVDRYGLRDRPDPVVHFATTLLNGPDRTLGLRIGESLLERHPHNHWILITQAWLAERNGSKAAAAELFERVLALPNQEEAFIRRLMETLGRLGLARIHRDDDPELARRFLNEILACLDCPNQEQAQRMLEELGSLAR